MKRMYQEEWKGQNTYKIKLKSQKEAEKKEAI